MSEQNRRYADHRGRVARRVAELADSPHMRFWPRIIVPAALAVLAWLIVDLIS